MTTMKNIMKIILIIIVMLIITFGFTKLHQTNRVEGISFGTFLLRL